MQELLALSELMAQMVRALTQGVCRADVRPLLGVLLVKLTILHQFALLLCLKSHESTMSGGMV